MIILLLLWSLTPAYAAHILITFLICLLIKRYSNKHIHDDNDAVWSSSRELASRPCNHPSLLFGTPHHEREGIMTDEKDGSGMIPKPTLQYSSSNVLGR